MPKIKYESIKLKEATLARIAQVNTIIAEYAAQGFNLTLRQLYYQFVSRGLIANNDREYKKLGDIVSNGRLVGLIDWEAITDRTRFMRSNAHWSSPESILHGCAAQFRLDKWARQPRYILCAIEKDALLGVIEGICNELDVPYIACRGYASMSTLWDIGRNLLRPHLQAGKNCTVLYLGDHDPSGIDMTRDVRVRLHTFAEAEKSSTDIEVKRLALNMDQVEEYEPPENPTKTTDSRAAWYINQYGESCWELDALNPQVISNLIEEAVLARRHEVLWQEAVAEEELHRQRLRCVAEHWEVAATAAEELGSDEDD